MITRESDDAGALLVLKDRPKTAPVEPPTAPRAAAVADRSGRRVGAVTDLRLEVGRYKACSMRRCRRARAAGADERSPELAGEFTAADRKLVRQPRRRPRRSAPRTPKGGGEARG